MSCEKNVKMRQRNLLVLLALASVCAWLSGCTAWEEKARVGLRSSIALERRATLEDLKSHPVPVLREDVERVLSSDIELANRALAADALGALGMWESLGELRVRAERDASRLVRTRAMRALARIQGGRAENDLRLSLRKDLDPFVRVEAVNLSAEFLPPKRAADVIVEGLRDEDNTVKLAAYHKLVSLTGKDAPPTDYERWNGLVQGM